MFEITAPPCIPDGTGLAIVITGDDVMVGTGSGIDMVCMGMP
jgi:hypothetical protein